MELLVFVEENGEGTITSFHESKFGASAHEVDFAAKGPLKVKLRRKGNDGLPWLVPTDEASVRLPGRRGKGRTVLSRERIIKRPPSQRVYSFALFPVFGVEIVLNSCETILCEWVWTPAVLGVEPYR
jgi:hypothetical protein